MAPSITNTIILANVEYMMSHKAKKTKYFKIGPIYYRFNLTFTLLTLVGLCILTYLGFWQIGRSAEKKHLLLQLEQKTQSMPLRLASLKNSNLKLHRFSPVLLQGTYLNNFTFLVDNQTFKRQVGYRVITVFQSPFLDKWILIDRGWVAGNPNRAILPNIQEVYGVKMLQGVINTIPTGIILKNDIYNPEAQWPLVIQGLDYGFISRNLNHPVYEFVVQLDPNAPGAYTMLPIDFGISSDKHLGYALQWFSFALILLIYYLLHSFKRSKD